jgi:trimeric autotransporter adhesin
MAMGHYALRCNVTGENNVAVGIAALACNFASNNTAIGFCALRSNTTATANVAVGSCALVTNTSGCFNTAIGYHSLKLNCIGTFNVAIGANALTNSSPSYNNVAVGYAALFCNSTGLDNTAIGRSALQCNTTGKYNTAVGTYSMIVNVTKNCNTSVGNRSLNASTGDCNTALGVLAGCCVTSRSNTISVGVNATPDNTDNHTVWGNASNNVCNCVYVDWTNVSDYRDKSHVESLPDNLGLRFINKLRPVKFYSDHRDVYVNRCGFEYGQKDGTLVGDKEHYGLIAQEIKQALNELNVQFDALGYSENQDAYRLTYTELIAPLIKAVQELAIRVTNLENK